MPSHQQGGNLQSVRDLHAQPKCKTEPGTASCEIGRWNRKTDWKGERKMKQSAAKYKKLYPALWKQVYGNVLQDIMLLVSLEEEDAMVIAHNAAFYACEAHHYGVEKWNNPAKPEGGWGWNGREVNITDGA
jgi:hypothetical protein